MKWFGPLVNLPATGMYHKKKQMAEKSKSVSLLQDGRIVIDNFLGKQMGMLKKRYCIMQGFKDAGL